MAWLFDATVHFEHACKLRFLGYTARDARVNRKVGNGHREIPGNLSIFHDTCRHVVMAFRLIHLYLG